MVMEDPKVKELNDLVKALSVAIKEGKVEEAKVKAAQLAEKKADVDMLLEPEDESRDKIISVNIHIEDMQTSTARPIQWNLKVSTKISQLKRMMHKKNGFRPEVQRWIVGNRVASDTDSLSKCGVSSDGNSVFLYLMSTKPKTLERDVEDDIYSHIWPDRDQAKPSMGPVTMPNLRRDPPLLPEGGARTMIGLENPIPDPPMDLTEQPTLVRQQPHVVEEPTLQIGWNCPKCTYLNDPLRPACQMCVTDRPLDYVLPPEFQRLQQQQDEMEAQRPHAPPHQTQRPQADEQERLDRLLRNNDQINTARHRSTSPQMVYNYDKMTYEYAYASRPEESDHSEGEVVTDTTHPARRGEDTTQ